MYHGCYTATTLNPEWMIEWSWVFSRVSKMSALQLHIFYFTCTEYNTHKRISSLTYKKSIWKIQHFFHLTFFFMQFHDFFYKLAFFLHHFPFGGLLSIHKILKLKISFLRHRKYIQNHTFILNSWYSVQCTYIKCKNKCMVFSYWLTEIIQFLHTCHTQSNNSSYCQWIGSFKHHLGMSLLSFTL
jgi:hypothetical protein